MAATTLATIIAHDENNEPYILLGKKTPASGMEPPGGYFDAKPPFSREGTYADKTEHLDPYQAELLKNPSTGKEQTQPLQKLISTMPSYDRTLADNIIREILQETGLVLTKDQLQWINSSTPEGETRDKLPYQHSNTRFLVEIKAKALPAIKAGDDLHELQLWEQQNLRALCSAD